PGTADAEGIPATSVHGHDTGGIDVLCAHEKAAVFIPRAVRYVVLFGQGVVEKILLLVGVGDIGDRQIAPVVEHPAYGHYGAGSERRTVLLILIGYVIGKVVGVIYPAFTAVRSETRLELRHIGYRFQLGRGGEVDVGSAPVSLTGGDDDYPVRGVRPINRGGAGPFQDVH